MKTYLPSLDGLRGVAALAVVGSHFQAQSGLRLHLEAAGAAVDFFFILSGFVIAQAYEARLTKGLTWADYMGQRLRRLYPAIFGGLVLGLLAAILSGDAIDLGVAAEFLLLPVFTGPSLHGGELFPLNGPQWSLFWELIANAVHALLLRWLSLPVLIAIVALSAMALIGAAATAGSLDIGWSRTTAWGGAPRVTYGFFMGVLLFRLRAGGWRPPTVAYPVIVIALAACLIRWAPGLGGFAARDAIKVIVVLPGLVALALVSPVSGPGAAVARYLGTLSYPLYAIHAPLLRLCGAIIDDRWDAPPPGIWWLALAATLALAAGFEHFYDRPIRAWMVRRLRRGGALIG